MNLPGMNPENNLPGYDIARLTGYGAPDFDFKALGAAMDCTREFYQAGIIYADGAQRYLVRPGQRHHFTCQCGRCIKRSSGNMASNEIGLFFKSHGVAQELSKAGQGAAY